MARNDTVFTKITGGPEDRAVWVTLPEFGIGPDFKATLPVGVTLKDRIMYAKDASGLVVGVIAGRPTSPPIADWEAAARRALEEALAARGRLLLAELETLRRRAAERGIVLPTPSPTDTPAGDDTKETN